MLFPTASNTVQLTTAAVDAADVYWSGLRINNAASPRVRASTGAVAGYVDGLGVTSTGQLCYVDATAGLPADVVWVNGLPTSGDKLCVSTNSASVWSNGIPLVINGAVAVGITP